MEALSWTFNMSLRISSDITSGVTTLCSKGCSHCSTKGFPRDRGHDGLVI